MVLYRILTANTGEDSLTLRDSLGKETIFLSQLIEQSEENLNLNNDKIGPWDIDMGHGGLIYMVNAYDNSAMKIDLEKNKLLGYIKVGMTPTYIKKFEDKIYVINSDSNSLSIIDEDTFSLIGDIAVGEKPTDMIIEEETSRIFIANGGGYTIDILYLKEGKTSHINLNKQPIRIAMEDQSLFVLSYINNGVGTYSNLSEIKINDYKTVMNVDLEGVYADFIKIDGKKVFYLSNIEDGCIYKICMDEKLNISKFYLGGMPTSIKWDGENIYISNILTNEIVIMDEENNQIIDNIRVGKEPNGILLL